MDNTGKSILLQTVVEYAKLFQLNRRRKRMSASDIHEAIFTLRLRPMYSSIAPDETVTTSDDTPSRVGTVDEGLVKTVTVISENDQWIETKNSSDKFRKRKQKVVQPPLTELSEISRFYIKSVVNYISSGKGLCPILPPSKTDMLSAAWYLGLFLSELAARPEGVHWLVVRGAVWYLEKALKCKKFDKGFAPWISGLERLGSGDCAVTGCESLEQETLIRKVCHKMYSQLV